MTAHLGLPYFLFFREQYFHFILEVLTTEKRAHTKTPHIMASANANAGPIFPWIVLPFCYFILEVLTTEKCAHTQACLSAGEC